MKDRPGVLAPPPLFFLVALLFGWLGRDLLPRFQSRIAATVLGIVGMALITWGVVTMKRARTNVDPYQPALTVVTTGPFRFTRNPLYLSMNLLYIAFSLSIGSLTALILLPLANVLLHYGVIRREERYLEAKFGDAYRVYRSNVRRWL